MDSLWLLAISLLFGYLAKQISLPPMAGFLVSGFVLHAIGIENNETIQVVADLGVTLLLFTIGLKLRLRNLIAPEVWGVGSIHMALYVGMLTLIFMLITFLGLTWIEPMNWVSASVVAFALSFSSTIFAVKILEDRGEMKTRHGQLTIGILIIQDIIAVLFLTMATGKVPSLWALCLLALPLIKPVLNAILNRSGHNEVLILFGMFAALGGGHLFELVGMKADLGALIFGVLLSGQAKTGELASALLSFKNIFLIGFFLSIGLNGLPSFTDLGIATVIVIFLLPIKSFLYYALMVVFRLRARTSFLASNDLSNFSEFGLIIAAIATSSGWLSEQWLMIIAVSLALSYVAAAMFNTQIHTLYARIEHTLHKMEKNPPLEKDKPANLSNTNVLILGMGRVGRGAYQIMEEAFPGEVCGIDADSETVEKYKENGLRVITGDAENVDFWHGTSMKDINLIMLAMPSLSDMQQSVSLIQNTGYTGKIAAVTKYDDDRLELKKMGVDAVYNFYAEAGAGFAEHVRQKFSESGQCLSSKNETPLNLNLHKDIHNSVK